MLWYNEQDGTLQSNPPYQGWLHPEEVPILYPEWKEVDNDFVLPTIPPTKEEKLNTLSFKYQETIENLSKAVGVATLRNNTTQIESLKKTYNEQTLKYKQERDVIING